MENQISFGNQNNQQIEQNSFNQTAHRPGKIVNYWMLTTIGLSICLLIAVYCIFALNNKINNVSNNSGQPSKSYNQIPTPTSKPSPVPSVTNTADFPKRQFAVTDNFFEDKKFPPEVISIPENNLIGMSCTKDYFSWSGNDYSYFDPKTNKTTKLSNPRLLTYLSMAEAVHGKGNITSISYCDTEDEKTIVGYRAGPCGGGCAGIQYFSYVDSSDKLTLIAKVQPPEEGPYYGCIPLELTKNKILYLKCGGKGTASIQKLDLSTGSYTSLLSCRYSKLSELNSTVICK